MSKCVGRLCIWALVLACVSPGITLAAEYTVNSLADDGPGTLRDAVRQSNAAGTPSVISVEVDGVILLTSGSIPISAGPVSIGASGMRDVVIDGGSNDRIFTIIEPDAPPCPSQSGWPDFRVEIYNLTLRNGRRGEVGGAGGAIFAAKSLSLINVRILNSSAASGGGLAFRVQHAGQMLSIRDSNLSGNVAEPSELGDDSDNLGGGIVASAYCPGASVLGWMNVADSYVSDNVVRPRAHAGLGGGIAALGGVYLTLTRSHVGRNRVDQPNPAGSYLQTGGGVHAINAVVADSEIAENFAPNGGGLSIAQTAVEAQTEYGRASSRVTNSTIWGNVSTKGGAGVLAYGNVLLEVFNSTVAANSVLAGHAGGVLLSRPTPDDFMEPRLSLVSSILAGARLDGASDLEQDGTLPGGVAIQADHSMVGKYCASCGLTLEGDGNLTNVDARLGSAGWNGHDSFPFAKSMPLLAGSPAKDSGSNPLQLANDQRGVGFPRLEGAGVDMGATEGEGYCADMTDVSSATAGCASVDWVRNRSITVGCANNAYCPGDLVTRAQIAIFMRRLGVSLTPFVTAYSSDFDMQIIPVTGTAILCQTIDVPPASYARTVTVTGLVNGLADGPIAWRAALYYSLDAGANWYASQESSRASTSGVLGKWSSSAVNASLELARGFSYRFAVGVDRDYQVGALDGNFSRGLCNIVARVDNRGSATAPF